MRALNEATSIFERWEWRIPSRLTKTQQPYLIPLSDLAVKIVRQAMDRSEGEHLFPGMGGRRGSHIGPSSIRARFDRGIRALRSRGAWPEGPRIELYDFRRFGRTQIRHKLGFSKEVAELVINHAESSTIDQLYVVHDYGPEVRKAHLAWEAEVLRMVTGVGRP